MKTLGVKDAALFLRIHPVTLIKMLNSGEVSGAKIGKEWVLLEVDLIEHIRAKYKSRALEGERKETLCHFTNAKTPPSGGSKLLSVDRKYKEALGLQTEPKPKSSMTN